MSGDWPAFLGGDSSLREAGVMGSRSRLVSDQHVELGAVAGASLERHTAAALFSVHLPAGVTRASREGTGDVTEA